MNTPRHIALPVVLAVTGCLLIVSFVTYGIADLEFNWGVETRPLLDHLPVITNYFRTLYHFWWVMPVASAVFGGALLIRPECQTSKLVWYVAIIALVGTFWVSFSILSLYLIKADFYMGK
jgi:hypothetical protein